MRVTRKEVERHCRAYGLILERRSTAQMREKKLPRWGIERVPCWSTYMYKQHPEHESQHISEQAWTGLRVAMDAPGVRNAKNLEECKQIILALLQEAVDIASIPIHKAYRSLYPSHYWHEESLASFRKKHAHRAEVRALEKAVPKLEESNNLKPKTRRL